MRYAALLIPLLLFACAKAEDKLGALAPYFGDDLSPRVVAASPFPGQTGVVTNSTVGLVFNRAMEPQRCAAAFSISPSVVGATVVVGNALVFTPGNNLPTGTYSVTLSTNCEDLEGRDLETSYSGSFVVGTPGNFSPRVIAVGLESQANCNTSSATGSASGGDWTIGNCWWSEGLLMLSPGQYTFRAGDTGGGGLGIPADCPDVNTDNFRVIFNNYMNTGVTANATTLRRLSGPLTSIRLASHSWSDCQSVAPYGCKVLTAVFSEDLASCNTTTAFGTVATSGDFNLALSAGSPAGYPQYMLQVDTTALDANGKAPVAQFSFSVEGK